MVYARSHEQAHLEQSASLAVPIYVSFKLSFAWFTAFVSHTHTLSMPVQLNYNAFSDVSRATDCGIS